MRKLDRVAKALLLTYAATLVVWLAAVYWYARVGRIVILGGGLLMWVSGAVTAAVIPEQAAHIAARTRYMVAAYGVMLILYRILHGLLNSIDPADWGEALGTSLPVPLTNAASGWIQMLLVILLVGMPATHTTWIVQLYMAHRGRARVVEAFDRYQRRTPG